MPEPKYIRFIEEPVPAGRKTREWRVQNKSGAVPLGAICWHNTWRKYVFEPAVDTLFDPDCLSIIAEFMRDHTREHRQGAR